MTNGPNETAIEPDAREEAPGARRAKSAVRVGRDTGVLMAGDLFDRALGFMFLIVATKIYGLEIYGAYLIALGVFQIVRAIVSFGLGRSLVRDAAAAVEALLAAYTIADEAPPPGGILLDVIA